jgi:hypothetical protein
MPSVALTGVGARTTVGATNTSSTLLIVGQTQFIYAMPQVTRVRYAANTMFVRDPLHNYPMDRADFRLVQGVTNEIYVYIADLAMIAMTGDFVITFTDGDVVLRKTLLLDDLTKGRYLFTLTPDDMAKLPLGVVRWSITVSRIDGSGVLLLTDRDTPYSVAFVSESPIPPLFDRVLVWDDFFPLTDGYYYSSALIGAAQQSFVYGTQSFTLSMTDFTGIVRLDGTLSAQPNSSASSEDWVEVDSVLYEAFTGDDEWTVDGNYVWVRLAVTPLAGTLDQVQYTV